MRHIYLIGFMGAGKSTIARALQGKLSLPLVEMDERIACEQTMSINEIFSKYGEDRFRDIESALVRKIAKESASVVSCGGGVVVRQENVQVMKESGAIILLTAAPETIYERVKDSRERPILNGHMNVEYIAGLMEKRRALYEAVADIRIATDGKTRDEICAEILQGLQGEIGM